ncbi:MAG: LLM class flavin-dependent oxidoreductase [Halieaceae bacterium]|jgi:alkanesulfonate monooxygenase SsuD/methylene tetrahydromethanopterin reductase-like flavin-dependent oxidoreductase (luciferase family)|nr:LLM class flavin-dependent oxidoreductase [Halieaceae bacterium]
MRVGISYDIQTTADWEAILSDIEAADTLGYDSFWVSESRENGSACSVPALFLTSAARRTRNIQLRIGGRTVVIHSAIRLAEEVAVLDLFSRGRAGIAFATSGAQSTVPGHVHETIEFVRSAWSADEIRYRGEHLRFPSHTSDDAPLGVSFPEWQGDYIPQWEWGPAMPDFLAITPKPYATAPPTYVDISEDTTLEWAANHGVSPFIGADMTTDRAVERMQQYRAVADAAGRSRYEVEAVLERRMGIGSESDDCTLGGSAHDLVCALREITSKASIAHFVWRRGNTEDGDLTQFAVDVHPLLQA